MTENIKQGRIKWISPEIRSFNGQENLGFSMEGVEGFLNIYKPKEELEKYLTSLKKGYEVKVTLGPGNIVEDLEITNAVVEEKKKFGNYPREDPKLKISTFSASYTKDLIVAGKVDIKDLETEAKRMKNLLVELMK